MTRGGWKVVASGVGLLAAVGAWIFVARPLRRGTKRPKHVFVNETAHHDHDTALKMSLKIAEKRSGIENALVLLQKLPPNKSIETVAEELFQRWQIGRDRDGRGILFVHSADENLFKIEVSYALEGVFPDVVCHGLEEAARSYMLSEVPQDFLSELMITMNIEGLEASRKEALDFSPPPWISQFLSGGAGVAAKGYRRTLDDYLAAVRKLPEEDAAEFQPSSAAADTVKRYLTSLDRGLGDPRLPLLTEGSQVFRLVVPRNPAQQLRILDYYQKGMPYGIYLRGDLGVAVFRPGVPNLPIVVRRSREGLWYVDEAKSWTYFHRWEDGTDFFPKYDDLQLLSALKEARHPSANQPIYRGRVRTPRPPSYPFSLASTVNDLETKIRGDAANPEWHARLGEVYLFEIDWLSRAIESFEAAARLDPDRLEYRWRLYDLYINDSAVEKALSELRFLAKKLPEDGEVKQWLKFYTELYTFPPGDFP